MARISDDGTEESRQHVDSIHPQLTNETVFGVLRVRDRVLDDLQAVRDVLRDHVVVQALCTALTAVAA